MKGDRVKLVPIKDIRAFGGEYAKGYFHIRPDKLKEIEDSIKEAGIIEPLIVRPDATGKAKYELIAGRTRITAAERIGLNKVPCIIWELSDEKALLLYGESNRYRDDMTITEKAFMYRYFQEHIEKTQFGGIRRNAVFEEMDKLSEREKHRRIRLTYLVPQMRELVDTHKVSINAATEISYLPAEVQEKVYLELAGSQKILTQDTARELRRLYEAEKKPYGLSLSQSEVDKLIGEGQKAKADRKSNMAISKTLLDRLPEAYRSSAEQERLIERLLEEFLKKEKKNI